MNAMNRLTKLIAPAIAASLVLGAAVPASAAPSHGRDNYRQEIAQLDRQIDRAQERRLISHREAQRLENKVDQLQKLHATYARNGFTKSAPRILARRTDTVRRRSAAEIADRDGAPQGRRGDHRR